MSDEYSTNFDITGKYEENNDVKYIVSVKDRYEIIIKLTGDDKFIEIYEIKVNKDFRTFKQKMDSLGYFDVEQYYEERIDEE